MKWALTLARNMTVFITSLIAAGAVGIIIGLLVLAGAIVDRNWKAIGAAITLLIVCVLLLNHMTAEQRKQQQTYEMPERIDASPEEIAQRAFRQKP